MTEITSDHSFELPTSPGDAWRALAALRTAPEWWLPGFEAKVADVDEVEGQRLTVRKLEQPCADSIIAITFEHAGTGTRLRVVQSGFDAAFVDGVGEAFFVHGEHLATDLALFVATGVVAARSWLPWAPLGISVVTEPYGLRIRRVGRGTWAERVGMLDGDVLLTVAGAPIFTVRELGVIERVVHAGDEVTATFGRAGERLEATAVV